MFIFQACSAAIFDQLLMIAALHFGATGPGGVQVQVRDAGHWVEFEGLWLGVIKDIERSKNDLIEVE